MSQQSYHQQSADGNDINFTITTFSSDEIKVYLDGVLKQAGVDYNINPYNTNSQSTVEWIGDHPTSGVVRVVRETDVLNTGNTAVEGKATFTPGSSIKAVDLNNNQKQVLRSLQEHNDQLIQTYDIEPDAITNAKIADSQIDSEHYVDGSIDREHLANDIIDGSKIADNSIDSEHYADLSIDSVHIANSAVTSTKIADNAVTTTEILNGAVTRAKLEADIIDGTKLADNAVDSEHYTDGSIDRVHLEADIIDSTRLADDSVNSEHYVDGSIDRIHLAADIVDGTKIADDSIDSEHIAAGSIDNEHYGAGSITADKLNNTTVITSSEQGSATTNDTSFLTSAAADARFFNISSGDTIKDGQTFPDNDTTIATTAAINDRIIDLVDDVGGFVPIANETSFPTTNPDINLSGSAKGGTIVSVKAASTNLVPSGTTVTIANGRGSGLAVIITGVTATIPSGFGFLVETTTTDHTYAFHRLVPNATEVTTVAGKATEIGRLGTAAAVEDMSILGTTDVVADMAILGTADVVSDLNTLGTADVVADMNTLAVTSVINNMDTVADAVTNVNNVGNSIANVNTTAGSIANVNTVAGAIANVNTTAGSITNVNNVGGSITNVNAVASNLSSVNNFANQYRIGSTNPTTSLDTGDLFFNTTSSSLKVYTGSAWVDGVTTTGDFALKTGNTFTGSNIHNDNVKSLYGTGSDLEIFHNGTRSEILNNTGDLIIQTSANNKLMLRAQTGESHLIGYHNAQVELYHDGSKKLETHANGVNIFGRLLLGDSSGANDNRIRLGADGDLSIYHDGSNSYIEDGGTGELRLRGTTIRLTDHDGSENFANFIDNGAVELFHNNVKKLETASFGVRVNDSLYVDEHILIDNDSGKIKLGTGADLQIYHDATHSRIDNSTGFLTIRSNQIVLQNAAGDHNYLNCPTNEQGVELFYDNVRKFRTTSSGVELTGNLIPDANNTRNIGNGTDNFNSIWASTRFRGNDNVKLVLGSGQDLIIRHDGTDNLIEAPTGMDLKIMAGTGDNANETCAKFIHDGGVELYWNNAKKMSTYQYGVDFDQNIQIGTHAYWGDNGEAIFGAGSDLKIYHDGSDSYIDNNTGNLNIICDSNQAINLKHGSENMLRAITDGAVELYHDNEKKLNTTAGGVLVTGDFATTGSGGTITSNEHVKVNSDTGKLYLGASNDLEIYHNGTNSIILNNTGELQVSGNDVRLMNAAGNEHYFVGFANSYSALYYDNSQKLATQNSGITVTGQVACDELDMADSTGAGNNRIKLGTGDDFQIYHDGSNGYLVNDTGDLIFQHGSENLMQLKDDGAVELYYDNAKKLATASYGLDLRDQGIQDCHGINAGGNQFRMLVPSGTDGGFRVLQTFQDGSFAFSDSIANFYTTGIELKKDATARDILPETNNLYDLGSSSYRWRNVYTNDLNLSNEGSSNDVDGTWGDWTIQEGESDLFLKNNRSGKKYKFNLMEVS